MIAAVLDLSETVVESWCVPYLSASPSCFAEHVACLAGSIVRGRLRSVLSPRRVAKHERTRTLY